MIIKVISQRDYTVISFKNPIILFTPNLYFNYSTVYGLLSIHESDLIVSKIKTIVPINNLNIPFSFIDDIKTEDNIHKYVMFSNEKLYIQFFYGVTFCNLIDFIQSKQDDNIIEKFNPISGYTDVETLYPNITNEMSFPELIDPMFPVICEREMFDKLIYGNMKYRGTILPIVCQIKIDSIDNKTFSFKSGYVIFHYNDNKIEVLSTIIISNNNNIFVLKKIYVEYSDLTARKSSASLHEEEKKEEKKEEKTIKKKSKKELKNNFSIGDINPFYSAIDPFPTEMTDISAEHNNLIEKTTTCIICLSKEANIIMYNCRHNAVCDECIKQLEKCPVCRSKFDGYIIIK